MFVLRTQSIILIVGVYLGSDILVDSHTSLVKKVFDLLDIIIKVYHLPLYLSSKFNFTLSNDITLKISKHFKRYCLKIVNIQNY